VASTDERVGAITSFLDPQSSQPRVREFHHGMLLLRPTCHIGPQHGAQRRLLAPVFGSAANIKRQASRIHEVSLEVVEINCLSSFTLLMFPPIAQADHGKLPSRERHSGRSGFVHSFVPRVYCASSTWTHLQVLFCRSPIPYCNEGVCVRNRCLIFANISVTSNPHKALHMRLFSPSAFSLSGADLQSSRSCYSDLRLRYFVSLGPAWENLSPLCKRCTKRRAASGRRRSGFTPAVMKLLCFTFEKVETSSALFVCL